MTRTATADIRLAVELHENTVSGVRGEGGCVGYFERGGADHFDSIAAFIQFSHSFNVLEAHHVIICRDQLHQPTP